MHALKAASPSSMYSVFALFIMLYQVLENSVRHSEQVHTTSYCSTEEAIRIGPGALSDVPSETPGKANVVAMFIILPIVEDSVQRVGDDVRAGFGFL